nr:sulfite exporter TauE/SafE family protein [Thiomonas sp.]
MVIDLPFPWVTLLSATLIIALAYTIYGLTGFGSSITAVPLLTHFLPLRSVVPMMLIFDLGAGIVLGLRNRSAVARDELLRIIPFMVTGMLVGVTLLVRAPQRPLLVTLGCFILAYAAWNLAFRAPQRSISVAWAAPLALLGGLFTALFGTGGPIYVAYLARRLPDVRALRATISTLIFFSGLARLVLFTSVGLYKQPHVLQLALALLPVVMGGLYLGSHLSRKLPAHRIVQAVWGILIAGGTSLIWHNL